MNVTAVGGGAWAMATHQVLRFNTALVGSDEGVATRTAIGASAAAAASLQSAAPRVDATPATSRSSAAPRSAATGTGTAASCNKLIEVNLSTQQLVAYECTHEVLATPITSGRPGLRTPTGNFTIFLKEQNVYFYSPWPQGDPNYYPPMFVAYAMEFLDGGFFLHTDPDEPASGFGPGSQDGPYASHGCVHVPYSVMATLYSWAADGAAVSIHY